MFYNHYKVLFWMFQISIRASHSYCVYSTFKDIKKLFKKKNSKAKSWSWKDPPHLVSLTTLCLLVRYCARVFLLMYILDSIDGFSEMWNLIIEYFTILWHCFKLFFVPDLSISFFCHLKMGFQTPAKGLESKTTH